MNELAVNEILGEYVPTPKHKAPLDFARLLRWLGFAAVVLSAIVFLVQGFDDIGSSLRNWAYLGVMALLFGVGVALKYVFADGSGARLLLGLAVAMLPIQFAQLAGMIHSLVSDIGPDLPTSMMGLLDFGGLSWGLVMASGVATLLLAFTIGLFGFRVLARGQALSLTLMNTLLCGVLLLPVREGGLAVAIVMALGLATLFADRHLTKTSAGAVLRTLEGASARLMLLLPLLIAGVRLSFYISDVSGFALLAGMVSMAMLFGAHLYLKKSALRELMFGLGAVGTCVAWSVWCLAQVNLPGALQLLCLFLVLGLFLLLVSKLSNQGATYRLLGSLLFAFAALQLIVTVHGMQGSVYTMCLGVLLAVIGYLQKWRMPTLIGAAVVALAIGPLTVQALANVEIGTWIGLAIAGVTLVVLASVVERYGQSIVHYGQVSWVQIKAWD